MEFLVVCPQCSAEFFLNRKVVSIGGDGEFEVYVFIECPECNFEYFIE